MTSKSFDFVDKHGLEDTVLLGVKRFLYFLFKNVSESDSRKNAELGGLTDSIDKVLHFSELYTITFLKLGNHMKGINLGAIKLAQK